MGKEFTDLRVKKLRVQKGQNKTFWDDHGLGIRVGPRSKTWVFRYTFDGRIRQISLGKYPLMSLTKARNEATRAKLLVEEGIDPGLKKQLEIQARIKAPTFAEVLEEFYEKELKKTPSGKWRKRLIEKDCLKPWGRMKMTDIKRRDIVVLLDEVEERAPMTRNRLHGVLTRMFNFAAERGIIDDSPCTRIRKPKEKRRKRVLSDTEIKALWNALDTENQAIDLYVVTKLALKMILLTGQRPGEVVNMRWKDLDLKARIWNNKATKTRKDDDDEEPVRVPLTRLALEVIRNARAYSGRSAYVFRSSHKRGPMTRAALSRALRRHWQEIEGIEKTFSPHDLRRTMRTRLAELGVDNVIAERVLGHKLQGILAVYNQYPYDKEKRQALEKWEIHLRLIVGLDLPNTKVVPLRRE